MLLDYIQAFYFQFILEGKNFTPFVGKFPKSKVAKYGTPRIPPTLRFGWQWCFLSSVQQKQRPLGASIWASAGSFGLVCCLSPALDRRSPPCHFLCFEWAAWHVEVKGELREDAGKRQGKLTERKRIAQLTPKSHLSQRPVGLLVQSQTEFPECWHTLGRGLPLQICAAVAAGTWHGLDPQGWPCWQLWAEQPTLDGCEASC